MLKCQSSPRDERWDLRRAVSVQLPKDGTGSVQSDEKMGRETVRQSGSQTVRQPDSQAVMLQAVGMSMSNLEPSHRWDLDLFIHDRDPRKTGTL